VKRPGHDAGTPVFVSPASVWEVAPGQGKLVKMDIGILVAAVLKT